MSGRGHDFNGYRVLVVGGTRGTGHAVARGFADAGAHVTVTGTMMLRELYDADLSGIEHEMVNLARQSSIDHLVRSTGPLDVLVLAAGCTLPPGLPEAERDFIAEAVRSGILGPMFLTTRLRLRLSQSTVPGGGCVVNTAAVRRWLELSTPPERSAEDLAASTASRGEAWAGIGVRVNTVLAAPRVVLPRQAAAPDVSGRRVARGARDTLVRAGLPHVDEAVTDLTMLLAGPSGARITGQTIRLS